MHHAFPNMKGRIALTVHKILIYLVAFYLGYSLLFSKVNVMAICLGTLIGLTLYDIAHYYCHFGPETSINWINNLKRNHLKHHYRDQNRGFGVTSTFWDQIFGT
jgi:dihydroceramide fatty acyl 2-hydroxylase